MSVRTRNTLVWVVAVFAIFFQTGAQAFVPCGSEEAEAFKCFTTIPSGYVIRIVETGECGPAGSPDYVSNVNGFPHIVDANIRQWCYKVEIPTGAKSAKAQLAIQIPLSFYGGAPTYTELLSLMNSNTSPKPTAFAYNNSIGCTGDSTGFEKGDREACGMQWPFQTATGGGILRFYYKTDARIIGYPGVAPQVLMAKIASSYETGLILGADSSASPFTPQANFVCQQLGGKNIKMYKDANNCVTDVQQCDDSVCLGTCTAVNSTDKVQVNVLDINNNIAKFGKVTELGTAGGNNFCNEGQLVLKNLDGTPLILLKTRTAFYWW